MKRKIDDIDYAPKLTDLLQQWIDYRSPAEASITTMQGTLNQFMAFSQCEELDQINRDAFIQWKKHLLETKGVKPVTWNTYLKHMRMLLRFAGQLGWKRVAIMNGIKTIPETGTAKKTIDEDILGQIIEWLEWEQSNNVNPGWFWANTIRFLYFTGVRRKQLVGLRWEDINTTKMEISLRAEHSKTKRTWSIPLHPALVPVLEDQRERTARKLKHPVRGDEQIFNVTYWYNETKHYAPQGRKQKTEMTVSQVSSAFKRIAKHTGLKISPHRFRHSFATALANQPGNGNLKNLQQILGHTNISTTLGYVQADMGVMRDMVNGLGTDLGGKQND